ncbi:DNA-formamidopyrimidine glycosylase [Brochothrix thermosphacta]|uniref:DNA-formamidopyrimidine glycosylase n=1 Tax=Brochothrix thermosphacta TaxID=2756 RepID=UPI00083FB423|nr:DNA-formamidopyrimidine glycosylase [Brochothrix thermosphacta]ODJ55289.1 DNA-formamidopyrimidine glycosylase [Brochothrix thermosphacta]ODJ70691.1 DNA-formamidopyrimidine glycosylase [Brochothrix thermosphacta]
MPELPEVENVRATLAELVIGRTIEQVTIGVPKMIHGVDSQQFAYNLIGEKFVDIRRRGKFLLLDTTNYTILSHLRMEGKYRLTLDEEEKSKHTHVVFQLDGGQQLRYLDVRKFGTMEMVPLGQEETTRAIKKLGPEPFGEDFQLDVFAKALSRSTRGIKNVLLDQKAVVGLGNIYVDEVCYVAKVNPIKPSNELNQTEVKRLYDATRSILTEAVKLGGSTIRTYVNSQGKIGNYQEKLVVYGHKGEPCPQCGTEIEKIQYHGRGTHYCLACQPLLRK